MFTFYRASAVSREGLCVGDEHGQGRSRDYTGIRTFKSPYFSIVKSTFIAAQNSPVSETLVNEYYVLSSTVLSIQAILVAVWGTSTALVGVHWGMRIGRCRASRTESGCPSSTHGT